MSCGKMAVVRFRIARGGERVLSHGIYEKTRGVEIRLYPRSIRVYSYAPRRRVISSEQ